MIRAGVVMALLATPVAAVETLNGDTAVLRGIDKYSGAVGDIQVQSGQQGAFGQMDIAVKECRYPRANPSGDAFAYVTISPRGQEPVFQGWMIASSPALNALDHHRYDVWLLRCTTS